MEYCRTSLQKLKASGRLDEVRRRQQVSDSTVATLQPGEAYLEITGDVGQMTHSDGGVRFVLMNGEVALLRPSGAFYRFDVERRLIDHGTFARWHSVRGHYASSALFNHALKERCSTTNGGVRIVPWQIRRASSYSPACQPHREDFRLVFKRAQGAAPGEAEARAQLFQTSYQGRGKTNASPEVVVGSAQSEPGYFKAPAEDLLKKVHTVVTQCAREVGGSAKDVAGQGELLLILGAFGSAKTSLVRRTTFAEPLRLCACIEQNTMKLSYESNYDVLLRIPFHISF
jgi:hypothetical protein